MRCITKNRSSILLGLLIISFFLTGISCVQGPEMEHYGKAHEFFDQEEYKKAIAEYDKVIEINPKFAEAYADRAVAYAKMGQYRKAIEDFDSALEIKPKDPTLYLSKAANCEDGGLKKEALDAYKKFLEYAGIGHKPYIEGVQLKISELEKN